MVFLWKCLCKNENWYGTNTNCSEVYKGKQSNSAWDNYPWDALTHKDYKMHMSADSEFNVSQSVTFYVPSLCSCSLCVKNI